MSDLMEVGQETTRELPIGSMTLAFGYLEHSQIQVTGL